MPAPHLRCLRCLRAASLLLFALVAAACSSGSARTSTALFACQTSAQCLAGYTCICNFCQQPGAVQWTCGADAAALDVGTDTSLADVATKDATADLQFATDVPLAKDAVPAADSTAPKDVAAVEDVYAGPCDLSTWKPCGSGYGCYYAPTTGTKTCQKHGSGGEGTACDPAQPQACGLAAADGRPLICDVVDKKCYRTCICSQPTALACPKAMTCYCLQDGAKPWPDGAGICAP